MGLDFMTNLDYNVQADNLKCKQPEQNVEKSRSLVERARLEIVYTPQGYRGFESLLLRHESTVILSELRWIFLLQAHPDQIRNRSIAGLPSKHMYAIMKKPLIFVRAARPPATANEMILRKDL